MIIGGDKKKAGGLVVDFMQGAAPKEPEEMGEDSAHQEAMKACAEDLIAAIHAKDASGVASAITALMEEHDSHESSESPEHEAAEHADEE